MAVELRKRSEIPVEYTWDAASVFPSDVAWGMALGRVQELLAEADTFRGRLAESAGRLADWFALVEELSSTLGKVFVYAGMFYNVDTADQAAAARVDRARSLSARAAGAVAFGEPEILAIGFPTLQSWTAGEPLLAIYAHYFDQLERRQEHVRSPEVEELLGTLGDPFRTATSVHGVLADADLTFKPALSSDPAAAPIAIGQGNIAALTSGPDRQLRRSAWENYADAHLAFKNTMANCLSAGVKQNVFRARARRFGSALEAALSANFIPEAVFHNVVDTFRRNLSTWHRYWRVRRQALGYDRLHVYDISAPLTKTKLAVSYDQAIRWIVEGMRPLGEEYVAIMERGLRQQRWVDVYPNQNKRSGAFSTGVRGTYPFIMMSFNDDIYGLSTLAHELGHSMHSYFTWQNQPAVYANYSIFVAEVASNLNQALVRAHLLESNPTPAFQIAVIEEAMANFHRYFFIMPTLARFELEIHERVWRGEPLTADSLIALMADLFEEGYGGEVELDHDRVGITWARFHTHLYSNFYVYQYTTGIAGAHALAADLLAGKRGAVDRYLAFLKAGSSLYPLEALQEAGVDLASPEPLERTFAVLAGMVDRLEKLTT
jgi:oligoendopeptidase F